VSREQDATFDYTEEIAMYMSKLNPRVLLFLLVLVVLMGTVTVVSGIQRARTSSAASEDQHEVSVTPMVRETADMHPLSWRNEHRATAEAALADPHLPADTREVYEREIAIIQADMTSIADAQAMLSAVQTDTPGESALSLNQTPLPVPTMAPLPRGILDDFTSPLPGSVGFIQSAWQDEVDDMWASAYAGAYAQNGDQGFIYVLRWQSRDGRVLTGALPGGLFDAPVQGGALTITAHNEGVLTLETEDGQTLFFDVRSLEFIPEQP
jgi:hypothetical protein